MPFSKAPKQSWGQFKAAFDGTYNIQNSRQQRDGSYVNQVGLTDPPRCRGLLP